MSKKKRQDSFRQYVEFRDIKLPALEKAIKDIAQELYGKDPAELDSLQGEDVYRKALDRTL